jgi:3-oxoacyl-[acyl-carrier-protein] synthase III
MTNQSTPRPGMSALSVSFPSVIRTNDYWREHHQDLVRSASEHALEKLWGRESAKSTFERAMMPYARDPFKGARERRVLGPEETALDLEATAVVDVLAAAGLDHGDLDLVIVSSLRPDTFAVGNAAWLAHRLGLKCPAINLETACSSSVFGLDLACMLVSAGRFERILVVTSCTYSRDCDDTSTLSWFLADGAGAFIVEARDGASRWLGSKCIPTNETCGAFVVEPVIENGRASMSMRATKDAGSLLHDTAEPYLRVCCEGALETAGLRLQDVDFFVFNTPTAWYADFCATVLGVDPARTISTYPIYTNIGPALMPVNLHEAASRGLVSPGDTVLMYSVGSASTAMAVVMRWGDVALGAPPSAPHTDWQP